MRKPLFVFLSLILACSAGNALDRQPNADYHARREALAKKVGGLVVLFAPMEAADAVYAFRQDDNFYYLSGVTEPGVALLIASAVETKDDAPARPYAEILFLPPHNLRREKYTGPKLGAENPDAPKITGFDRVEEMGKLPDEVSKVIAAGRPVIYTDVASQGETSSSAEPLMFLKRSSPVLLFQDVKPMLTSLRTFKDAGEAALIRKAVDASVAAHVAAMKAVKPNVPEFEISALMQYEWDRRGCERPSYSPIVGSGHNSTILHYSENSNTVKAGDVVVIDAAAEYSMYAADITRTLPANGHFTARQREIYDIVLGAQEAAMAAFQSGKSMLVGDSEASLNKVARDYIKSHGKDLHGQPLDQ
jgi:Xaa-Pro aminopeptidase